MPLLDAAVAPRIWLGNRVTVPAHFDESFNLACVIAGQRRFTLFPPDQVGNLYIGPLDFAPTGAAMSLVRFGEPIWPGFQVPVRHSPRPRQPCSLPAMRSSSRRSGGITSSRSTAS